MRLTDQEKAILDGEQGEARRMAMAILVDLGKVFGAERLIPVSQVHIDATIYMVDAGVEFAEHMAESGGRVAVPTSLNPSAIDLRHPEALRVPADLLENSRRLEQAYLKMGAVPTWTCAPYQTGVIPRFGEQIAWAESNAIAFANSVIGARTNRYADLMDISAAMVGKVPRFGLHLAENRKADVVIQLTDISTEMLLEEKIYPLLGYLFGELAGDRVAALTGIPENVSINNLKHFSAAAATTGAVGLFHLVGVTPEAPTLKKCLRGERPQEIFEITPLMIRDAERLRTVDGDTVDLIVLGCPHYSLAEFQNLVRLLGDRKVHPTITFWVFTSRAVHGLLLDSRLIKTLSAVGVSIFTDGCTLQFPKESWHFNSAMSDSAKFTHYCYSQTRLKATFGSTAECVVTAVCGKIVRSKLPWR